MPSSRVVLMLSLMLGLQALSTDLYLPALPVMRNDLSASMPQVQLTLSALLLSFGLSQLAWGPVSDRWGRRPVLLAGWWAYTLSGIACTWADSIEHLIVWRSVQGVALGAVVMCARAIVRDLYAPLEGARTMSKSMTGLGMIALLCAPTGSLLTEYLGWRYAMSVLAIYAFVSTLFMHWGFKETLRQKRADALSLVPLLNTWAGIVGHPTFRAYALLMMGAYGAVFTFLASSSFVLIEVIGLSRVQYGLVLLLMSTSYITGTLCCRRLLLRWGQRKTIRFGVLMALAGGVLMFLLNQLGSPSLLGLVLPFYLIMVAHGIHQPIGQSGVVAPFPKAAGAASALSGFLMMAVGFAIGHWMGRHLDGTVFPLVAGELFWTLWLAVVGQTLVQRHGEPHA